VRHGLTCLAVVELEVAHGVLLVADARASGAAVEGEVRHEAATAFLDEQAHVHHVGGCRHVEHNVLQTRRLRRGPVHARRRRGGRDGGGVEDKVAHLPEEDVDRLPVEGFGVVRVAIDEAKAGKVGRGLEGGRVGGVANELGEVGREDRR